MKNPIRQIKNYWVSDTSFITLLGMLIFMVFAMPILLEYGAISIALMNMLFLGLYFIGIFSSRDKGMIYLASVLFVVHLVLQMIRFDDSPNQYYLAERCIGLINMSLFMFINIRLLFRDAEVNSYRVIGAVNVYLLIAISGAFIFEILGITMGNPLGGNVVLEHNDRDYAVYVYYSLASLTTVGYGDIYANGMPARMVSVMLSAIGILYPAVIIARLVTINNTGRERDRGEGNRGM